MGLQFLKAKVMYLLSGRNMSYIINSLKKNGVKIGDDCNIYSDLITSESYLITIKNNVTISNDVQFITHDNSICKVIPEYTDVFGEIVIGNNCFIGARTIILPGVTLADNIIVGSGSVVTKSFHEEGVIVAGNPAKIIGNIKTYTTKINDYGLNVSGLTDLEKKSLLSKSKLVVK
jgi:acetyltransferase-like isoleucine patch superfamily enzyme